MSATIRAEAIPYVTHVPTDGRRIVALPFFDVSTGKVECYAGQPDGSLFPLRPISLVTGAYTAMAPADEQRDIALPFSETVFQHLSVPGVCALMSQLESDLQNGLASLHKYFILLRHSNATGDDATSSLVSCEVEYAFTNHRSFYDLVHRVIMCVNETYNPNSKQLKDSFAKVAKRSLDELCSNLNLPLPVAEFYERRSHAFFVLRDIRDCIAHHGHSPGTVYVFDDGFGLGVHDRFNKRLEGLKLWPEDTLKPNSIGSLLAVLEYVVWDMFDTMFCLGDALLRSFDNVPPRIADGMHVYLRTPLAGHYYALSTYQTDQWMSPSEALDHCE